jgi:hypothetical protein
MSSGDWETLARPSWSTAARTFPPAGTPEDPDFGEGGAWPWDWSAMSRDQAQRLWDRLDGFVAYLNDRYAWDYNQQVPMCWAFHGAIVEELTTLYWSRWSAFTGPDANPDKAQAWHAYYLPGFYVRLGFWCGGGQDLNRCQSGRHVEARHHDGRDGAQARWAEMTEELRETDEDSRRAESVGYARSDDQPYPPLSAVPLLDLPPPDYDGPKSPPLI